MEGLNYNIFIDNTRKRDSKFKRDKEFRIIDIQMIC